MQAIKTAYLCPTNVRGSRIKASTGAGSIFVSYDHSLNLTENRTERDATGWYRLVSETVLMTVTP